jgi:multidrug transporter EmrE-like cation transporter
MISATTLRALGLLLVAILFTVSGELFLKHGMNRVGVVHLGNLMQSLARILQTPHVLAGFGLIGVGALFWLAVLSRVDLSFAYPMLAFGYVLAMLFSVIFLKEHVSSLRWIGALVICLGVYLISRS